MASEPTAELDELATSRGKDAEEANAKAVKIERKKGELLFRRGDDLNFQQYSAVQLEAQEYGQP